MTRKNYLAVWGYLQALKDILDNKSKAVAQRQDDIGTTLAADYTRQAVEITALQQKIQQEADRAQE